MHVHEAEALGDADVVGAWHAVVAARAVELGETLVLLEGLLDGLLLVVGERLFPAGRGDVLLDHLNRVHPRESHRHALVREHKANGDLRRSSLGACEHRADLLGRKAQPPAPDGAHDSDAQAILAGILDDRLIGAVEQVVLERHAPEEAGLQELYHVLGVVVAGEAPVANQPLFLGLAGLVDAGLAEVVLKRLPAQPVADLVEVDVVTAHALEAGLEPLPPALPGVALEGVFRGEVELRAVVALDRFAEHALAPAVAVARRGIQVVDAQVDAVADDPHGFVVVLWQSHEAPAQRTQLDSGVPELAVLHGVSPMVWSTWLRCCPSASRLSWPPGPGCRRALCGGRRCAR